MDFNAAIGSAMKRTLMVNDSYGHSKVMREAVLDEFNGLMRYLDERLERLRDECLPTIVSLSTSEIKPKS